MSSTSSSLVILMSFKKVSSVPIDRDCLLSRTHYPESRFWRVNAFNALLVILFVPLHKITKFSKSSLRLIQLSRNAYPQRGLVILMSCNKVSSVPIDRDCLLSRTHCPGEWTLESDWIQCSPGDTFFHCIKLRNSQRVHSVSSNHQGCKKALPCHARQNAYSPELTVPESGLWRVTGFNVLLVILFSIA